MKKLYILGLVLASSVCHADIINCSFTEPFITSSYSMTQSTLTYTDSDGQKTVIQNVSMQIKSAGVFELRAQDGRVLQTLTLNNNGSDGMSDKVYPYDVKDQGMLGANNGLGGCESNLLRARESNN